MPEPSALRLDVALPLARFPLRVTIEARGRALAVLGRSGAGKTSLLEAVCGLRPGASGSVSVRGRELSRLPPEQRRVGYVPQDGLLFPHLTVQGNVRFGLKRSFDEAVALTGIRRLLGQYPSTLSGGERQRVALARALATGPELLLLDEPLASVDVELRQRILPYLLRVRDDAKVPLVYVTHHWGEARVLAEEVLVLEEGRVKSFGPAADILTTASVASWGDAENVVHGTLAKGALVLPGGARLSVPGGEEGQAAFSVPAEDILIAAHTLAGISARNLLAGEVQEVSRGEREVLVRVHAAGIDWLVRVTPAAADELSLAPGKAVQLVIKSHSFRRLK